MIEIPHIVVGGGLAGLSIANELRKRGEKFVVLEAEDRLGGRIETECTSEACFEYGPSSFVDKSPEIMTLIRDLGLEEALLVPSPAAGRRYIVKNGQITALPGSPRELWSSKALSARGKLRFLREFFYVPPVSSADETVDAFFTRHFGAEVARYFVDPFVSGIFAGHSGRLSVREAFPRMVAAEAKSSSLLRYLIREKKQGAAVPRSYQLQGGLQRLFHRALSCWGEAAIHCGDPVLEISPLERGVSLRTASALYRCERVYLTAPAYGAATLLRAHFQELSELLEKVEYPQVALAHVKVSRAEAYPFDGFGLLIPSSEGRPVLGTLWNSTIFPQLFPDKAHHYLTVYCGGARAPETVQYSDDVLAKNITAELMALFNLKQSPTLIHLRRHPHAIPQYTLQYSLLKQALLQALQRYPRLHLAGNYMGGISMPDTVAYGAALVRAIFDARNL